MPGSTIEHTGVAREEGLISCRGEQVGSVRTSRSLQGFVLVERDGDHVSVRVALYPTQCCPVHHHPARRRWSVVDHHRHSETSLAPWRCCCLEYAAWTVFDGLGCSGYGARDPQRHSTSSRVLADRALTVSGAERLGARAGRNRWGRSRTWRGELYPGWVAVEIAGQQQCLDARRRASSRPGTFSFSRDRWTRSTGTHGCVSQVLNASQGRFRVVLAIGTP